MHTSCGAQQTARASVRLHGCVPILFIHSSKLACCCTYNACCGAKHTTRSSVRLQCTWYTVTVSDVQHAYCCCCCCTCHAMFVAEPNKPPVRLFVCAVHHSNIQHDFQMHGIIYTRVCMLRCQTNRPLVCTSALTAVYRYYSTSDTQHAYCCCTCNACCGAEHTALRLYVHTVYLVYNTVTIRASKTPTYYCCCICNACC